MKSATITTTMPLTTAEVVEAPTEAASLPERMPRRQPAAPTRMPNTPALASPTSMSWGRRNCRLCSQ